MGKLDEYIKECSENQDNFIKETILRVKALINNSCWRTECEIAKLCSIDIARCLDEPVEKSLANTYVKLLNQIKDY